MICPWCRAGGTITREAREGTRPNANARDAAAAHQKCTNPRTCPCQHLVDLSDGPVKSVSSP